MSARQSEKAAMPPSVQSIARVIHNDRLAESIFRLTIHAPEIAGSAVPGQFIMIRTNDGYDPLLRRPFSIHQATANGRIQILYRVTGKGTRLMAALKSDTTLDILGPLGNGFSTTFPGSICLVGGGMGIAPLFFLARQLAIRTDPRAISIFLGARNKEELVCIPELMDIGYSLKIATDDGSEGYHGLVTDLLEQHIPQDVTCCVYSCGPYPMLKKVALISKLYNWHCQVSLETMMACGIAACLGCVVPQAKNPEEYFHVCKDGPVFDSGAVAW